MNWKDTATAKCSKIIQGANGAQTMIYAFLPHKVIHSYII